MNRAVSQIEQIIADIGFTGLGNAHSGIISAVRRAAALCRELEMGSGEELCNALEGALLENDAERAEAVFCRLCCYCECVSN